MSCVSAGDDGSVDIDDDSLCFDICVMVVLMLMVFVLI